MKPISVFTHFIFHEENASYEMLFIPLWATEEHSVPWNDSRMFLPEGRKDRHAQGQGPQPLKHTSLAQVDLVESKESRAYISHDVPPLPTSTDPSPSLPGGPYLHCKIRNRFCVFVFSIVAIVLSSYWQEWQKISQKCHNRDTYQPKAYHQEKKNKTKHQAKHKHKVRQETTWSQRDCTGIWTLVLWKRVLNIGFPASQEFIASFSDTISYVSTLSSPKVHADKVGWL